jgi:hypothetical protein
MKAFTSPLRSMLLLGSLLALSACGSTWDKEGLTPQQWQRDSYECTLQGRQAAAGVGASGIIVQEMEATATRNRCLEVRGYARVR